MTDFLEPVQAFDVWHRPDFLFTVAQYLIDNGSEATDLLDLIEKPHHYVAEYKAAKALETESETS